MVFQNPLVVSGLTLRGVSWALTTSSFEYWHPVTWLSHMLDCELFGASAGWHHLGSVAFHALNALLLFLVLQKITGFSWRSALVAALFALHPLRVESVAWIAERKDLLSGLFFLLTIWAYAHYAEGRRKNAECGMQNAAARSPRFEVRSSVFDARSWGANAWYKLALLFFTLGLMSKPMVVTLPFVLLLLDFWPLRRVQLNTEALELKTLPLLPLLREKLPFFCLSGFSCWITVWAQQRERRLPSFSEIGLTDRLSNTIVSYLQYLGKMFWPADLAVLYPHPALHYPVSEQWPSWEIVAGALLLLAISALCICQLRHRPWLAVGWFWYLGTMLPVIGLVQIGDQAMADRYTYIPLIGPVISLVWLLSELWNVAQAASPAGSRGVSPEVHAVGMLPLERTATSGHFQFSILNFQFSILRPSPLRAALTVLTLLALFACALLARRQVGYWRNSVTLFDHTVQVTPDNPTAQCNLGYGLSLEGKPALAAVRYRAALAINPRYAQAHFNLAGVLKDQAQWPEAAEHYLAVTRLKPELFLPHLALAQILPRLGRTKEAASHLEEFLRACPGSNLEAPNSPILELALDCLNNLAWFLATSQQVEDRDGARAVRFAERACELTQYSRTPMVGTLAAAYAEAGRFPDAIATAEKACALAVLYDDQALLKKNQQLLELYRAGKAYRETGQPQTANPR